jgi:hypothetical protein
MNHMAYSWLVLRALYELIRYDVVHGAVSASPLAQLAGRIRNSGRGGDGACERAICDAVVLACCLYWKPVLCLQRSVCAMRMLRSYGIAARVVVGYRPAPFFSHAWVEVDGRVVNDSAVYQRRLTVLYTI